MKKLPKTFKITISAHFTIETHCRSNFSQVMKKFPVFQKAHGACVAWWEGSVRLQLWAWHSAVPCVQFWLPIKYFPSIFKAEVKKQRRENTLCSKNGSQNRSGWRGHLWSPEPPPWSSRATSEYMAQDCVQTDPVLPSEGDFITSLGHLPVHGHPHSIERIFILNFPCISSCPFPLVLLLGSTE